MSKNKLPPTQQAVVNFLEEEKVRPRHADADEVYKEWYSTADIAAEFKKSLSAMYAHLRPLEVEGYLERKQEYVSRGKHYEKSVRFVTPPGEGHLWRLRPAQREQEQQEVGVAEAARTMEQAQTPLTGLEHHVLDITLNPHIHWVFALGSQHLSEEDVQTAFRSIRRRLGREV